MQQSNRHGIPKASVEMGLCVSSKRTVTLKEGVCRTSDGFYTTSEQNTNNNTRVKYVSL